MTTEHRPVPEPREYAATPQQEPFVIMNPRSGGGRVGKFGLRDKATGSWAMAVRGGGAFWPLAARTEEAINLIPNPLSVTRPATGLP
jgi:hypothetical protein